MTDLILQRIYDNGKASHGYLLEKNPKRYFHGWTLEDEKREIKLKGETRISAGKYRLKLNKVVTPLTQKYRDKYPWFTFHIQIMNVPNFSGVYIHVGNTDQHTDGCILLGNNAKALNSGLSSAELPLGESVESFKAFYSYITPKLEKEENVFLTIYDEIW